MSESCGLTYNLDTLHRQLYEKVVMTWYNVTEVIKTAIDYRHLVLREAVICFIAIMTLVLFLRFSGGVLVSFYALEK